MAAMTSFTHSGDVLTVGPGTVSSALPWERIGQPLRGRQPGCVTTEWRSSVSPKDHAGNDRIRKRHHRVYTCARMTVKSLSLNRVRRERDPGECNRSGGEGPAYRCIQRKHSVCRVRTPSPRGVRPDLAQQDSRFKTASQGRWVPENASDIGCSLARSAPKRAVEVGSPAATAHQCASDSNAGVVRRGINRWRD